MDIVEITWLDACGEINHIPVCEALKLKPLVRRNYGQLIEAGESHITLCFGDIINFYQGERALDYTQVIPRGMILKIKKLGETQDILDEHCVEGTNKDGDNYKESRG